MVSLNPPNYFLGFTPTTNQELKIAVNRWIINQLDAIKWYGDINEWNTENISDMSYLFYDAYTFNNNLSKWNTSNVIDMSYMFYRAKKFNQDLNNWDISNVKSINHMFTECKSLIYQIRWEYYYNIVNCDNAFLGCKCSNDYIITMIQNNIENNKIKCCIIM